MPMLKLRNGGDSVWEMEAKVGRAKAYLVGSPYATDFGFSNVLQGPLQVSQPWQYSMLLQQISLGESFLPLAGPSSILGKHLSACFVWQALLCISYPTQERTVGSDDIP